MIHTWYMFWTGVYMYLISKQFHIILNKSRFPGKLSWRTFLHSPQSKLKYHAAYLLHWIFHYISRVTSLRPSASVRSASVNPAWRALRIRAGWTFDLQRWHSAAEPPPRKTPRTLALTWVTVFSNPSISWLSAVCHFHRVELRHRTLINLATEQKTGFYVCLESKH